MNKVKERHSVTLAEEGIIIIDDNYYEVSESREVRGEVFQNIYEYVSKLFEEEKHT